MNIWEIRPDVNNYWMLKVIDEKQHWETLTYKINGQSLVENWNTLYVKTVKDEHTIAGDFPAISGSLLVMSQKAYSILGKIIADFVEELSIEYHDDSHQNLVCLNVITVLDCLNTEKSQISHFDDGRLMWVEQHDFDEECVNDTPIFKIVEHPLNRVYVNDKFKQVVEQNNLKGLIFRPTDTRKF